VKAWPKSKGDLTAKKSRRRAAQEAGLSLHQYRQAIRVSNIPKDEFERLVESDDPPTVSQLAALGRRQHPGGRATTLEPCPHCGGTGRISVKK
jgi:hypothetical protein